MPDPNQNPEPRIVLSTLLTLSASVLACCLLMSPLAWLMRDGLGPDSTDSTGWLAAQRMFWGFYWGPIVIVSLIIYSVALICRRLLRNK